MKNSPNIQSSEDFVRKRTSEFLRDIQDHIVASRIFVCMNSDKEADTTIVRSSGSGNFFCQYGVVKEWIVATEDNFSESSRKTDE